MKRVCILSFAELARDARVLRQADYLARDYDVTVVGWSPLPTDRAAVRWRAVPHVPSLAERVLAKLLLVAGRLVPAAHDAWFRTRSYHREGLRQAIADGPYDVVYANEWLSLPAGAEVARRFGAKLIFDAHEYSPAEWEDRLYWRLLDAPLITHVLRRYGASCDASITVSPMIAERYRREFALDPMVVLNAPPAARELWARSGRDGTGVRLIHHGIASPVRRLDRMIDAVALADSRFELTFMLVGNPGYVGELRARAEARAPGRVHFVEPVPPSDIVPTLAAYDMGIFILETRIYNYAMALPNKFFDYLCAGLPVCIGPSPAMAELTRRYGCGCVAPSSEPADVAATLNAVTADRLREMSANARAAASELNADVEMGKLISLVHRLAPPADAGRRAVTTARA